MIGTQIVINNMTPEDITQLLTGIVRHELHRFAKETEAAAELPEFMSPKQVQETLGVSRMTLTNWAKNTDERAAILVPLKLGAGRLTRYRRDDVLDILWESRRFANSQ